MMRRSNTDTPLMLDFCLRFPRCIDELLKRVTVTSYRYFTNPVASYYLQPTLGDVDINFCDLAKLPKPLSRCLNYPRSNWMWSVSGYSTTVRVSERIPQGTFQQKTSQAPCHWTSSSLHPRSNIQLTLAYFSMKTSSFNTKIPAQHVTLSSPSLGML